MRKGQLPSNAPPGEILYAMIFQLKFYLQPNFRKKIGFYEFITTKIIPTLCHRIFI